MEKKKVNPPSLVSHRRIAVARPIDRDGIAIAVDSRWMPPVTTCRDPQLLSRLRLVCHELKLKGCAHAMGTTYESARRYLAGQPIPWQVLVKLCITTRTSIDWLLLGREPRLEADRIRYAIEQSTPSMLASAASERLSILERRLRLVVERSKELSSWTAEQRASIVESRNTAPIRSASSQTADRTLGY